MESLEIKDFAAAILLSFIVWVFGGLVIGFLGSLIGVDKSISTAFYWLLVIAIPMFYLYKRARK